LAENNIQNWVLLLVASNLLEANLIKGKLNEQGIPVTIQKEAASSIYGLTSGPLAEVKVFVPLRLKKDAQAILANN